MPRYRGLQILSGIIRLIGGLTIFFAVAACVLLASRTGIDSAVNFYTLVIAGSVFLSGLCVFAFGQLLQLLVDMAVNLQSLPAILYASQRTLAEIQQR
jgi:hypothetical protein